MLNLHFLIHYLSVYKKILCSVKIKKWVMLIEIQNSAIVRRKKLYKCICIHVSKYKQSKNALKQLHIVVYLQHKRHFNFVKKITEYFNGLYSFFQIHHNFNSFNKRNILVVKKYCLLLSQNYKQQKISTFINL